MIGTDRLRVALWLACGIAVVVLGVRWFLTSSEVGRSSGNIPAGDDSRSAGKGGGSPQGDGPAATGGRRDIYAQASGFVRRPGVYRLPDGSRVFDLIRAAGGISGGGDGAAVQLAVRLADGVRIEIPQRRSAPGSAAGAPVGAGPVGSPSGPVSLSTATVEQLEALDGIGPALAKRIVEWRGRNGGFASVEDLDRVPGIGPAKFDAIKDAVVP